MTKAQQKKRLATIRAKYGDDYFSKQGKIGGKKSKSWWNEDTGKELANRRWKNHKIELSDDKEAREALEEFNSQRGES